VADWIFPETAMSEPAATNGEGPAEEAPTVAPESSDKQENESAPDVAAERREEKDEGDAEKQAETKPEPTAADAESMTKTDGEMKDQPDAPPEPAVEPKSTKKKKATPISATPSSSAYSKRERKSMNQYVPPDFKSKSSLVVPPGRGQPLSSLMPEEIQALKSEDLSSLHRFIFKPSNQAELNKFGKQNLLDFAGFLPPKNEELSQQEQDKIDEEHEVCAWGHGACWSFCSSDFFHT
jgi:hypothetical protein